MKTNNQLFDNQDEKISQRFRSIRDALGLQQGDFAKRAGIHQSQVSEIEKGTRNITAEILLKLEDTFNVNWRWLARNEGEMFLNEQSEVAAHPNTYGRGSKSTAREIEFWRDKFLEVNEKYTTLLENKVFSGADKRNAG